MKNKFSLIIVLLLVALFFPFGADAKDYSIDKVDIKAQINTDGSMLVEEKRIYNFNGDYTFAFETFQKDSGRNEPYIFDGFQVCDEIDCYQELSSIDKTTIDEKRHSGTFYVDDQNNQYYIKWFYRANYNAKVFTIKYNVKNAITLGQDVAELYWQWIGKTWDVGQNNILVEVGLPDGIGENIKAYGHGPLDGIVRISEDSKTVTFTANKLNPGNFFEGRIILPRELFFDGAMENLTKSQIESEENNFIKKTESEKQTNKIAEIFLGLISLGLLVSGVVWFFKKIIIFIKIWKETKLPEVNLSGRLWEPPSDIDPGQVEQLINGTHRITPKSFTATILSLVQHRFYKITRSEQKEGFWFFKDYKYYLVPLEKSNIHATSIEKYVLDFLKEISNETLELKEIADWCRAHQTKSYKFFKKFPEIILKENVYENFFEEIVHKSKDSMGFILMILIIFGEFITVSIGAKYQSVVFISIVSIFILTIFLFVGIFLFTIGEKRTKQGSMEAAKWIAFKKHMEEYNQTKNYPIDSIVLWEKYLVYGTVLGVSTKALSALPVNFSDTDKSVLVATWGGNFDANGNVSMINIFSSINSITNNMTSASSSYGASGSGSSGGFSGGGGGGGGSSGGGAG